MQLTTILFALVGMNVAVEGSALPGRFHGYGELEARQNRGNAAAAAAAAKKGNGGGGTANAASGGGGGLALDSKAVQSGSAQDGSTGASAGQAKSLTDKANFINFCSGKTLTNGKQVQAGSCNGIVMGEMPASSKMVSSIIVSPLPGKEPAANTDFDITVQMTNMDLGTFTNPDSTYYAAPQQLNSAGLVMGHTHVVAQQIDSLTPTTPPDASKFAFFKGINDAGNGQGKVSAKVTGGLPAGIYRICTMAGASNHQPLLMPVAQRGNQDDCVRIEIGGAKNAAAATNTGTGTGNGGKTGTGTKPATAKPANGKPTTGKPATKPATTKPKTGTGGNDDPNSVSTSSNSSNTNTGSQTPCRTTQLQDQSPNDSVSGGASSSSSLSSSSSSQGSTTHTHTTGKFQTRQDNNKGFQANPALRQLTGATKGPAGALFSGSSRPSSLASNGNIGSFSSSSLSSLGSSSSLRSRKSGSIGGIKAPAVVDSGNSARPFSVNGNTFVNKSAAVQRACAIQNNQCANAVNAGKVSGSTVNDCKTQEATCIQRGGG